jgi:hypothetical protein
MVLAAILVGASTMARPIALPPDESIDLPEDMFVSPEEGRRMFDEAARELVGMSGEEFIRRFDAGEFAEIPDDEKHRNIIELGLMIRFGR